MSAKLLADLCAWYARHCDEEWEHHHGIEICTLDNPGWRMKVDLKGTALLNKPFGAIAEGVNVRDHPRRKRWLVCRVEDGVWLGFGDETRLADLIERFLAWANDTPA